MIFLTDLYLLFIQNPIVCTDTRTISEGCLFFALKGDSFNGNKFASEALEKGAGYAIIDDENYFINNKTILVKDVLKTLQELAHYHRQKINPIVIAITGSNGKTTTKELIYKVLSQKHETLATAGNLNNHIGVPLTLLKLEEKHTHAIIEMGANHRHEIELLCSIASPKYGVITNIGKAHLEGFGGEEGVAKGKTELYYYLFKNKGKAFVNLFEENTVIFSKNNTCIYYSGEGEYSVASLLHDSPDIAFELSGHIYHSVLSGAYNFNNILTALAVGKEFNIEDEKIGEAIASYIPQNMRHQWLNWNENKVLLDAYNANPGSMIAALKNFDKLESSNKIVILGDMFELGNESRDEHQIVINYIGDYNFEEAIVCGKHFSTATALNAVRQFDTFEALQNYFNSQNYHNKTILIKGSRGMKMERLIGK